MKRLCVVVMLAAAAMSAAAKDIFKFGPPSRHSRGYNADMHPSAPNPPPPPPRGQYRPDEARVPEGAIAAAFVNFDMVREPIDAMLDEVLAFIPGEMGRERDEITKLRSEVEMAFTRIGLGKENLMWAVFAAGIDGRDIDSGNPFFGAVVRVHDASAFERALAAGDCRRVERIGDVQVYCEPHHVGEFRYLGDVALGIYRNRYIIISSSDDGCICMKPFIRAYDVRNHGGKAPFVGLDDPAGNVVARLFAPNIGSLVNRFGLERDIAEFAEISGDDRLLESAAGLGDLKLELSLNGDGARLVAYITAANEEDAKFFGNLAAAISSSWRFYLDSVIYIAANSADLSREDLAVVHSFRRHFDRALSSSTEGRTASLALDVNLKELLRSVIMEICRQASGSGRGGQVR